MKKIKHSNNKFGSLEKKVKIIYRKRHSNILEEVSDQFVDFDKYA